MGELIYLRTAQTSTERPVSSDVNAPADVFVTAIRSAAVEAVNSLSARSDELRAQLLAVRREADEALAVLEGCPFYGDIRARIRLSMLYSRIGRAINLEQPKPPGAA